MGLPGTEAGIRYASANYVNSAGSQLDALLLFDIFFPPPEN